MSPLELAANLLAGASILLAGRNSVHTWWTGIVGCGLFAFVFLHSRLYADTVLQAFFVITSVVGWWQWLHGSHGEALPVTDLPVRKLWLQLLCGAARPARSATACGCAVSPTPTRPSSTPPCWPSASWRSC